MIRRVVASLLATATLTVGVIAPADAKWSSTSPTFSPISTALSLSPPTSPAASAGCALILLIPRVTLTWTPSASAFTAGYDILRSLTSGGPYTQVGTATGGATATYTDVGVGIVGLNTTYYYVIRARRTNWISTSTAQVSAKTPLLCL